MFFLAIYITEQRHLTVYAFLQTDNKNTALFSLCSLLKSVPPSPLHYTLSSGKNTFISDLFSFHFFSFVSFNYEFSPSRRLHATLLRRCLIFHADALTSLFIDFSSSSGMPTSHCFLPWWYFHDGRCQVGIWIYRHLLSSFSSSEIACHFLWVATFLLPLSSRLEMLTSASPFRFSLFWIFHRVLELF